jgi:hypothetical protein
VLIESVTSTSVGAQAAGRGLGAGQIDLACALPALRHGQVYHAIANRVRHVHGRRVIVFVGDAKDDPVVGQPGAGLERELADLQRLVIDLQLRQAPGIGREPMREPGDKRLGVAVGLLEVVRLQEQAFGPQHLAIPGHASSPSHS